MSTLEELSLTVGNDMFGLLGRGLNYFVTAHELAHQWWGQQLIGGRVEGSNMMSETLAEYSAYMVMQEKFGKDYMHRVMHHVLDRYLRGRAGEVRRERHFLIRYRYANAANQEDAAQSTRGAAAVDQPYPDTRLLIEALRAQTPPEFQYLIDDGFDRIVLYDNKTVSAKSHKTADGRHEVRLEVEARKVQVDGDGVETPMPLSDFRARSLNPWFSSR
jgi:ABC-2 type transport system permease protein